MLQDDEKRILRAVQRDATLSARDLAERLNLSTSTVWRRMKEMEDAGVITGRVVVANPDKLGLSVCLIVNVNIVKQTSDTRKAFEDFVLRHAYILQCYAVTGGHDYMLVVRARSVEEFERVLMDEILSHPSVATTRTQLVLQQKKNTTALPL